MDDINRIHTITFCFFIGILCILLYLYKPKEKFNPPLHPKIHQYHKNTKILYSQDTSSCSY